MRRQYAIYGSLVLDTIITSDGKISKRLGGSAYYSSIPMQTWRANYQVYTAMSPALTPYIPGWLRSQIRPVWEDTTYYAMQLKYDTHESRTVTVESRQSSLPLSLPYEPAQYSIVNPVFDEITLAHLKTIYHNSRLTVTDLQGFSRSMIKDEDSIGTYKIIKEIIENSHILHVSTDDIPGTTVIFKLVSKNNKWMMGKHIVLTRGFKTPIIIEYNNRIEVDSSLECPTTSDTTGAGDYYTSLLTLIYTETYDIVYSAREAYKETCRWLGERASSRYTIPPPP
jgi:hypothetical protein